MLDRIWKICSEEKDRHLELEKLKNILTKNEYPPEIVDKEIMKFNERKKKEMEEQREEIAEEPAATVEATEKKTRFLVLPYVSKKAEDFAKRKASER